MQISPDRDIREKLGPYLLPIGRTVAGLVLGIVLSFIGIVVAWGLFIFFGFQSLDLFLGSLFIGAGMGAGVGGFSAWLHLDRENSLILGLTAALLVGAGILGAWGGYEYGSTVKVECCAMPTKSPTYYTAFGATMAANAAGLVVGAVRAYLSKKGQAQIHNAMH